VLSEEKHDGAWGRTKQRIETKGKIVIGAMKERRSL
jgi:hypothetical protein